MKKCKLFSMKLFLFLLLPALVMGQDKLSRFTVNGSISNPKYNRTKVYLSYYLGKKIVDSATVENEKYSFSGDVAEPTMASLWVKKPDSIQPARYKIEVIKLFLSAETITVKSNSVFNDALIIGSVINRDYFLLLKSLSPYQQILEELSGDARTEGKELKIAEIQESIKRTYLDFASKNPTSKIALYALQMGFGNKINVDSAKRIFKNFSPKIRKTKSGNAFIAELDGLERTEIGRMAPLFEQADTAGNVIKLSDFRGQYILIDFWASWCFPCRFENPNVVRAFNEFKGKGFTVIGVSLDKPEARQSWLNAIRKDGLTWTNLSDLKFWKNSVARLYGITSIPQNFLVDPSGKIVARNLKGEKLLGKLRELIP